METMLIDRQEPQPPKTVKLEYFEEKLIASENGRRIIELFERFGEEAIYLVNKNRRVGVTWNRFHGLRFIQEILKQGLRDDTAIPREIEGVTLQDLLLRMGDALQQHGSQELRRAIGRYALAVFQWADRCRTLGDMYRTIHNEPEMSET